MLFLVVCLGCGDVKSVKGGTSGILLIDDTAMSDMQITFYQKDVSESDPVGFAVSTGAGRFEMLQNGATGPLYLPAGEYRCTVETAGAPLDLPKEYLDPNETPVIVNWKEDEPMLVVKVELKDGAGK
jgi:hypothetical protein